MNELDGQESFLDDSSPSASLNRDSAQRALDELFSLTRQYKSSKAYRELLNFIARFRFYSPFNAMLIHVQMSGATFVAPPHRWLRDYRRRIKPGGHPLVILQPMGPVMFVFDVSDTVAEEGAPPIPQEVVQPFEVRKGKVAGELKQTMANAIRDGIDVHERDAGSQSAGLIRSVKTGRSLTFQVKDKPQPVFTNIPLFYELLINARHSPEAKYATLVHELGHLYSGHLGTPDERFWPDRRGLPYEVEECEAESICFLVCSRLGIDNPSDEYLAGFVKANEETPSISLECVLKAAGLIEQMGRQRLKPRKERQRSEIAAS
jgi:hypothetical protein